MKALTIYQPYATLLVRRLKRYETRSWQTSYRGPMAVHAAKRPPSTVLDILPGDTAWEIRRLLKGELLEALPIGYVVGTGMLLDCHLIDEAFVAALGPSQLLLGDYTLGRYAWEYGEMRELPFPVPAKGTMGLWEWNGGQYECKAERDGTPPTTKPPQSGMDEIKKGDLVICMESGVVGWVIKQYWPTACPQQTMVQTIDGRHYHAPTTTWRHYEGGVKG